MADDTRIATLHGRLVLSLHIDIVTGLHIGGSQGALAIGGVDSPIIRDPLTQRPYLPGSSLRGKMRSLSERSAGLAQTQRINNVYIHSCQNVDCEVCAVFGVPAAEMLPAPTRLIVRDSFLTAASASRLEQARTDLPYAEQKWEAAIDRVTSAATPRQIERVPAGAVFGPAELVYSIYQRGDLERFRGVVGALQMVEDDYLGGYGSRGGGQVRFTELNLTARSNAAYGQPIEAAEVRHFADLSNLLNELGEVIDWLQHQVPVA
ncbi:MAG: type III-A CRISPR-associated RAMP protein Csm3 [Chloroflexota bacterium]